jgi:hypothetical protein
VKIVRKAALTIETISTVMNRATIFDKSNACEDDFNDKKILKNSLLHSYRIRRASISDCPICPPDERG